MKRFLEANKFPHKEGHHAALPLTCPLCERETSQTVFINKTTGGLVCPPCKVHGELVGGLSLAKEAVDGEYSKDYIEGVGLDVPTIATCFTIHPMKRK